MKTNWVVALLVITQAGCGLKRAVDKAEPNAAGQTEHLKPIVAETKQNSLAQFILESEPNVEVYAGTCIDFSNENFMNSAGETCKVITQKYNAKTDSCTESIQCESKDNEIDDSESDRINQIP